MSLDLNPKWLGFAALDGVGWEEGVGVALHYRAMAALRIARRLQGSAEDRRLYSFCAML